MTLGEDFLAAAIFAFTYCFLAFEKIPLLRLDRTGGVLVGGVLMVACGVLTFDEAWQAIDGRTITLLAGMMILNVCLEQSGFFRIAAARVLRYRRSPSGLLIALIFSSGLLSALFLNDTVCLMLTLPLVRALEQARLPRMPYLIALAMSANVGSVMTITGNPQNMLIHGYSGYGYLAFLSRMLPVGLASLAVLTLILLLFFGRSLRREAGGREEAGQTQGEPLGVDRRLLNLSLLVMAGVLVGFTQSPNLSIVAITGAAVLLVVSRLPSQALLVNVNWLLLVFFIGLFVVVGGVAETGVLPKLAAWVQPIYGDSLATQVPVFSALTVVASNVFSNVPFVILAKSMMPSLLDESLMWLVLSMASTFAGNLTVPGSVATLIVLQLAGPQNRIGFWQFTRIGVIVTIATTALGASLLVWMGAPR